MKNIIKSLLIVVAVAAIAGGATWAYFSDKEEVLGSTFSAGSLDLIKGETESLPFAVENVKPGDDGEGIVTLTNGGNIAGSLFIKWTKTVDEENGILDPEAKQYPRPLGGPGLTTADYEGNGGELDFFLQFAPFVDVNKDGEFNSGDIQLAYNGQSTNHPGYRSGDLYFSGLNSYAATWNDVMTLNPSESVNIVIPWQFPIETTDNNYHQNMSMTDSLGFDMEFTLTQTEEE